MLGKEKVAAVATDGCWRDAPSRGEDATAVEEGTQAESATATPPSMRGFWAARENVLAREVAQGAARSVGVAQVTSQGAGVGAEAPDEVAGKGRRASAGEATTMTEKCGHGLVAEDEIKKGEFVIEYVGEVIDDRTCENRLWTMKRLLDTDFYLCEVSSNMVIDATNKGNRSRFINHSCEPNTAMQKWTVDGETRVGIFALRDIKIGEELTYDYKYVGCWIIDFDQETKMHTLKFNDLHTEKFNLKEEEWHFLEVDFDED
ncbi:Histone-lysine N-methyltransferase ASHH3 [Zea mays]|uniref:Histone-lysine N-methyltransferase ASHH3 n=1 Tax=Zea mays TaxID=4577 RepID=A0A1D6ENU8_MAIZE|nr:Histone-lysine N-methyltransferase ASHH3 [Zea mays]